MISAGRVTAGPDARLATTELKLSFVSAGKALFVAPRGAFTARASWSSAKVKFEMAPETLSQQPAGK
jgi:hypothetical protein